MSVVEKKEKVQKNKRFTEFRLEHSISFRIEAMFETLISPEIGRLRR